MDHFYLQIYTLGSCIKIKENRQKLQIGCSCFYARRLEILDYFGEKMLKTSILRGTIGQRVQNKRLYYPTAIQLKLQLNSKFANVIITSSLEGIELVLPNIAALQFLLSLDKFFSVPRSEST